MSKSNSLQIFLNSKSALKHIDNFTSNCIFYLPKIQLPKHKKLYISVQNASIPYTFFNCDYYNNKLIYTVNDGSPITITIPEGNYNVNTLKLHLESVMTGFTITYSSYNNRYKFTHSTYDFNFSSLSTCFELLGFTENVSYTSTSRVLNSSISINFFTIRNIYVQCNNIILNNINSSTIDNACILCSIPIKSNSYSVISYSNDNNVRMNIDHIENFSNLHIQLTDQDGDTLDLNGCHFSLTLQLDIVD